MNIGTRIKNAFAGMWEDTQAVSPIVATLVLVVVAITGAAAVGTIMGTFSSDVSEESNTGELTSASSTEILIAGSTTVQPVSELLAEAYMDEHQGVKVTVQGGGSGAGVSSTGLDIVDIGAASRNPKDPELEKYPNIQTHKIGGSAVVVIAGTSVTVGGDGDIDSGELNTAYMNDDPTAILGTAGNVSNVSKLYDRAEESGTEDTFRKFLANETINDSIEGKTGNAGMLKAVQDDPDSIGFVDFGFADGASDIQILGILDNGKLYPADDVNADHIADELKDEDGENYVTALTRPLNYLTNGEPNSMEQAFIDFAMSPGATTYFHECGYFAITEFA